MTDSAPATAATVWCANPDHNRKTRAMFRVTYLNGRFNPTTACRPCARWVILDQAPEAGGVTLEAIPGA